jgi:hypothetical protein
LVFGKIAPRALRNTFSADAASRAPRKAVAHEKSGVLEAARMTFIAAGRTRANVCESL